MATIDLGKLRFTWKGIFDANTAYEVDDVVHVDGSTYVVVNAIAAGTNQALPDNNVNFELMARGLKFRGAYNATSTYLHNEVVTHDSAAWISLSSSAFSGQTPGSAPAYWEVLVPAPLNTPLTTPGDMVYVDNDGQRVRLPIGDTDATLTAVKKPRETFSRFTYAVHSNGIATVDTISAADASRTAGTYTIGTSDYTTDASGADATFQVVVAAGGAATVSVTYAGGGFVVDETITIVDAKLGGGGGASLTFDVATLQPSSNNKAKVTNDDNATEVYVNNPTTLHVTRGEVYSVTFPANGLTYSLKQTRSAGTGNRLTSAPDNHITNGGTLTFNPANFPSGVTSFFIGDEANGNDELFFTVNNEIRVPSWSGGATTDYKPSYIQSNFYNTDEQELPLPAFAKKFGHGNISEHGSCGVSKSAYLGRGGRMVYFGNGGGIVATHQAFDGSYGGHSYPDSSIGVHIGKDVSLRMPAFFFKAIAGDSDYAHFLTDLNGASLGYQNIFDQPKIIKYQLSDHNAAYLTENGMLYVSGDNAQGIGGYGAATPGDLQAPSIVTFFDQSSSLLSGSSYPKIKHFASSIMSAKQGTTRGDNAAVDTNGFLYTWGLNTSGALGDGSTTANLFARQLPKSTFGGENVKWCHVTDDVDCAIYVITDSGKCWAAGNNADGALGLNSASANIVNFTEVTGVASSPLNGKKIAHIMTASGGQATLHKTWFLTEDGQVFFAGHSALHGAHSGVYNATATVNQIMPIALTDAATTIESGGQKVISMWTTGGSLSTQYLVTDGGTSGVSKVYSFGENLNGQLAREAPTAHGNSATVQGDWFLAECEFTDQGDTWQSATASSAVGSSNRKQGVRSTFETGGANANCLKMGNVMKITSNNTAALQTCGVMMLDDNGQAWICGRWNAYNPNAYTERDSVVLTNGGNNNYFSWTPCWGQPEKFVDICQPHMGSNATWWGLGESGTLYVGGYTDDGSIGMEISNYTGWSAVPITQ